MNAASTWTRHWHSALALAGLLMLAAPGKGQMVVGKLVTRSSTVYFTQPSEPGSVGNQPTPIEIGCPDQTAQTEGQGPQQTEAIGPVVEKNRKLSRTFAAPITRPYVLNTRYGRVQINVWSRKEVRTDVDITTRAESDEKAQQLLEMIQVSLKNNDPEANGGISATTTFGTMPRECWSKHRLYEVNYTVWLPKNQALKVMNTFGDVSITGDLSGPSVLAVEYGTLRTGRLEGEDNVVRVKNGSASVEYARKAVFDASYAKLRLVGGNAVELRNNYSDIDIGTVQNLTIHSKYGDVALGTVKNLEGTSGFSKFSIDKVSERLDMTVQHCPTFEVRNTSPNFRQINLDGGYSTILLNFPDGTGFNFDVNTQNGKLLVDKRLVTVRSEESSPASSDMQGQFGRSSLRPTGNVNIKTKYTNVSFNK